MPYFGPKMGQPGSVFNSECPKYYYCSALLVLSILRPESLIFYYLMRLMHSGKYRCMAIPSACLCSACMRAPDNWVLGPIYGTRSAMQQWEKKQNWQYIVNEPLMVGRLLSLLNDWLRFENHDYWRNLQLFEIQICISSLKAVYFERGEWVLTVDPVEHSNQMHFYLS